MKTKIGETDFLIPHEAYQQHLIVLGKTGAGKSYALRRFIEILLAQKHRVCIVDPKGDHWGIKSSADGRKAGYPVVIFGGDHADVPLNPRIGKEVAELIATGNRPSVIDFRGWMPGDRTTFWIDFASTLFKYNRNPLWLVIDEVHNFAPQGKVLDPQAGKSLHWTNRIASEGRGIGIKLFMASQRPQKVHKDTLTCAETLVAMRVIHPLDRKAMKEWIDGIGDKEKGNEVLNSLASIKRGEAFVWSPEVEFYEQITFPTIETYDSFAAPTSSKQKALTGWAGVDLDEIKSKLENTIEEAKQNDPAELKKKIRQLEKELKNKQPIITSVEVLKKNELIIKQLKEENKYLHSRALKWNDYLKKVDLFKVELTKLIRTLDLKDIKLLDTKFDKVMDIPILHPEKGFITEIFIDKDPHHNPHARMQDLDAQIPDDEPKLTGGAKRMIEAAVAFYPGGLTEAQVRAQAGLKKGGHYNNCKSSLKTNDLIEEKNGLWYASDRAMDLFAKVFQKMPVKTEDVIDLWKDKLPGRAMEMLGIILHYYPNSLTDRILQEEVGLAPGGHYNNLRSKLKTAELIVIESGQIKANKETLLL